MAAGRQARGSVRASETMAAAAEERLKGSACTWARTKHDGMAAVGSACAYSLPAALDRTAHVRTASAWATGRGSTAGAAPRANTGRRTHARPCRCRAGD
jgi:hypothetical protein